VFVDASIAFSPHGPPSHLRDNMVGLIVIFYQKSTSGADVSTSHQTLYSSMSVLSARDLILFW
jgi:hypothetical protein